LLSPWRGNALGNAREHSQTNLWLFIFLIGFCATTGLASPEHLSILFRGADFALSGAVIFVV
jgi:hypothetical protein